MAFIIFPIQYLRTNYSTKATYSSKYRELSMKKASILTCRLLDLIRYPRLAKFTGNIMCVSFVQRTNNALTRSVEKNEKADKTN